MIAKTMFPKVMCIQHPDSISRYISTQEEPSEAVESVQENRIDSTHDKLCPRDHGVTAAHDGCNRSSKKIIQI